MLNTLKKNDNTLILYLRYKLHYPVILNGKQKRGKLHLFPSWLFRHITAWFLVNKYLLKYHEYSKAHLLLKRDSFVF